MTGVLRRVRRAAAEYAPGQDRPLRAPFTRYAGTTGDAELGEEVRGTGLRHSVGELVSCPFCLGVWVATGFGAGLVFAPRFTRLAAMTFTAVAASDTLQLVYAAVQQLPRRAAED